MDKIRASWRLILFPAFTRSRITASQITSPLITCCQKGEISSKTKPLLSTPIINAPITVPIMVPLPPLNDVLPITTAAIESSSYPLPALGWAESNQAVTSNPATAHSIPVGLCQCHQLKDFLYISIRGMNALGKRGAGINPLSCGIEAEPTVDEVNNQACFFAESIHAPG